MSPERRKIPDWAQRERRRDLDWIRENLDSFWPKAKEVFQESGRGAMVVDTTSRPTGEGNPYAYFPQEVMAEELQLDEDTQRLVQEYDPETEFVIVLWKTGEKTSAYRVKPQPRGEQLPSNQEINKILGQASWARKYVEDPNQAISEATADSLEMLLRLAEEAESKGAHDVATQMLRDARRIRKKLSKKGK